MQEVAARRSGKFLRSMSDFKPGDLCIPVTGLPFPGSLFGVYLCAIVRKLTRKNVFPVFKSDGLKHPVQFSKLQPANY